jgi:hypothetical protein
MISDVVSQFGIGVTNLDYLHFLAFLCISFTSFFNLVQMAHLSTPPNTWTQAFCAMSGCEHESSRRLDLWAFNPASSTPIMVCEDCHKYLLGRFPEPKARPTFPVVSAPFMTLRWWIEHCAEILSDLEKLLALFSSAYQQAAFVGLGPTRDFYMQVMLQSLQHLAKILS